MKTKPKIEKPKNDIHYYRVSSKEQVENFSLPNQEKFCKELTARDGYNLLLEGWKEKGESAKTADRTQLQLMMRYAEKNKKRIARLVVYKVDRLSRVTADYLALKTFFNRLGISVVSATEKLEDTPGGKFYETLLSAAAEFDNNVRAQRTKEGMRARLLKGLWSGKPPWGYVKARDETGCKIIAPHPEREPIVKMLFEKYATGKYSFKELAILANKKGARSRHGMKMTKQLVSKIIKNPIYYGKIQVVSDGVETSQMGSHKKIISEKLFEEANSDKKGTAGRKLPRNKDSQDYPLRGIKCAGCGKSISGGKTRSKTGRYYQYYGCFNGNCSLRKSIKKIDLEDDFSKLLLGLTPNNDYIDVLKEAIILAHKTELNSVNVAEKKILTKISELEDKRGKLLNRVLEGKMSEEDFAPIDAALKFEILELKKEMSELSSPELEVENVINAGMEFIRGLPLIWKSLDAKDLRVLRSLLFPENLIYHYPTIKTPEVACIYNIESQFLSENTRSVTPQRIEL